MGNHSQFPESKQTPPPDYLPKLPLLSGYRFGVESTSYCLRLILRVEWTNAKVQTQMLKKKLASTQQPQIQLQARCANQRRNILSLPPTKPVQNPRNPENPPNLPRQFSFGIRQTLEQFH